MKNLGPWLVDNAGLISVAGALIIFFSWTVTNTLGQRYSRLKQSVETADQTFRLYTTLHELRDSLNSVAMETVYAREAAQQGLERSSSLEADEVFRLRRDYSRTRMSAHQIRELMDFAAQTLDYSSGVGTETGTAERVKKVHEEIYGMYAQVRDLDRAAEEVNASPTPDIAALRGVVGNYVQYVREEAIPQARGFYEAIVDASNARHEEGRRELRRAKRAKAVAARIALILYLFGSALALGGQYLDKVYKKRLEAQQTVALGGEAPGTTSVR